MSTVSTVKDNSWLADSQSSFLGPDAMVSTEGSAFMSKGARSRRRVEFEPSLASSARVGLGMGAGHAALQ